VLGHALRLEWLDEARADVGAGQKIRYGEDQQAADFARDGKQQLDQTKGDVLVGVRSRLRPGPQAE
jgi:hypothetical protein